MKRFLIRAIEDDRLVAEIIKESPGEYQSKLYEPEGSWNYPIDLFGYNRDWDRNDADTCIAWLKNRVIPETRQGLRECLDAVGLPEYDYEAMIKLNRGRNTDDNFYVEIEDSVEYREMDLKCLYQHLD